MSETPKRKKQEKFWSKKPRHPDRVWDYIVIGSGMGGMTSAALLAKLGHKVLVIEQHYTPGGFTHMFKRPNYIWDVGVHAVGEVTEHSLTGRLLKYLTNDELKWSSLGDVYDEFYFPDGVKIDFPDNPHQFRDNLIAAFPDEVDAIDRYLEYVREVASGMRRYYLSRAIPQPIAKLTDKLLTREAKRYFSRRTQDVLEELTDNEKLRTVLAAQWGYYGSPPSRSSFAIQALVVKHFFHGGYYPVGGAKEIAQTLLKTVASAGGWTRISTDVEQILLQAGRAVGVRLKDGSEIHAKKVISAAGVLSTIQRLLPPGYRGSEWARSIQELQPAPAHVCLYLGFKGDIREAGASSANKWFYETWNAEVEGWDVSDPDSLDIAPILYCSFPSLKDPEHDPGDAVRHTGEVVTFIPWESSAEWKDSRWRKRGDDYEGWKTKLQDRLLEQFLSHMPGLRDMVDHVELSTPVSTDHFCRPVKGSIYGLEPTPERFENPWLRPRSPIPGLFFSGSEVASVGVIGAMIGGVLGALAAEPIEMLKLLKNL